MYVSRTFIANNAVFTTYNDNEPHCKLGPSIKPGTWNIPEDPGTWNNYHYHEKNM